MLAPTLAFLEYALLAGQRSPSEWFVTLQTAARQIETNKLAF